MLGSTQTRLFVLWSPARGSTVAENREFACGCSSAVIMLLVLKSENVSRSLAASLQGTTEDTPDDSPVVDFAHSFTKEPSSWSIGRLPSHRSVLRESLYPPQYLLASQECVEGCQRDSGCARQKHTDLLCFISLFGTGAEMDSWMR